MFYRDDGSWLGVIFDSLALGGMWFLGNVQGKKQVYKEVADQKRDEEIERLKKKIEEFQNSKK
jgi:hypothetical protein